MDTSSSVTWLTSVLETPSTAVSAAVTPRDVRVELQMELVADAVDRERPHSRASRTIWMTFARLPGSSVL